MDDLTSKVCVYTISVTMVVPAEPQAMTHGVEDFSLILR